MVPPAKTPPKSARRHASTALVASAAAALALSRAARDASSKFSEVSRQVKRPRRDNGRSTGHNQNPGDTAGRIPDPDSGSVDSFERNALGPLLWHRPLEDELQIIPTEFKDDNSYVKAFEPVLLEETREETRNAWCESLGEGRQYRLTFRSLRVVHGSGGWRVATFSVDDRRTLEVIKSLCPEHSVGVLCVEKIAGKDPWPRNKECDGVPLATAGFVEKVSGREKIVEFKFFVSPEVDNQVDCSTAGWKRWHELVRTRERHVLEAFEGTRRTIRGKNSARSVRDARIAAIANETFSKNSSEFLDLTRDDAEDDTEESPKKESGEFPPPPLQKPEGRVWWLSPAGKLSSASQSYEALHHVRRLHKPMRDAMLRPPNWLLPKTIGVEPPSLATEITNHPALIAFLDTQFNTPQVSAIRWAAAHTLRPGNRTELDETTAERVIDANTTQHQAQPQNPPSSFPFTLVQGPPGTGKTHTVWGILNVLHFVLFQRYYQSLHRAIDLGAARSTGDAAFVATVRDAGADAWIADGFVRNHESAGRIGTRDGRATENPFDRDHPHQSDSAFAGSFADRGAAVREMFTFLRTETGVEKGYGYGVAKPKILVCAPSNAAVDNLLERILTKTFVKGDGGSYSPSVIRVGAADAIVAPGVQNVTASSLVDLIVQMKPQEWDAAYRKQDAFQKEASRFVKKLEREHVNAAAMYGQHLATRQFGVPDPVVQQHYFREQDVRVTEMLRLCDDRDKAVTEMARFAFCLKHLGNHVESTGGTAGNTKHTTGTTNNTTGTTTNVTTNRTRTTTNFSHQRDLRVVRNALEASFVDDAEIVFATLTSSSRRVFRDVARGFDTVLIDEAAQANEIATLIPFLHGAKRCVLVGDPRQLPSTVLSAAAKRSNFQRSLFERFVGLGAEPILLQVQYRMHPEIRAWPSRKFYDGRLEDSKSVTDRELALNQTPYQVSSQRFPLGAPYKVFDVVGGSSLKNQHGSLSNPEEALFVVCLYSAMVRAVEEERKKRSTVGGNTHSTFGTHDGQITLNPEPQNVNPTCAIITPYRQQRTAILKAFASLYGGDGAAGRLGVRVSTIDGFQGQEADVVILSTVRGSDGYGAGSGGVHSGGVGFLADVRRMNVALTRAKRALWVCGRLDVLRRSDAWRGLVVDAEQRGCVVAAADASDLFANVVPVEKQNSIRSALNDDRGVRGNASGRGGDRNAHSFSRGWGGSGGDGGNGQQVPLPPGPRNGGTDGVGKHTADHHARAGLDYGDL